MIGLAGVIAEEPHEIAVKAEPIQPISQPDMLNEDGLPSAEGLEWLILNRPEIVLEMVRKLYVLEQSKPRLLLPDFKIVEREDGTYVVDFEGSRSGRLLIGTPEYNLDYELSLRPKVVAGFKPEPQGISPAWGIAGGVLLLTAGFVAGVMVTVQ